MLTLRFLAAGLIVVLVTAPGDSGDTAEKKPIDKKQLIGVWHWRHEMGIWCYRPRSCAAKYEFTKDGKIKSLPLPTVRIDLLEQEKWVMSELEHLLRAVAAEPESEDAWLVLADWLDGHGVPGRAELIRLHRLLLATCSEPERHPERKGCQARLVELLAHGMRPCVPHRTVPLGGGVDMAFHFIPPGTFLMGSPPDEKGRRGDETRHRVTLTAGLWLGTCPVTQAQWKAVMGSNPSRFKGDGHPVETVSWHDCVEFCRRLGHKVSLSFGLPTEAAWEHACRAGTATRYHFGEKVSVGQANCGGGQNQVGSMHGPTRGQTTPVESFVPNAWGLFDLHGNVWEWTGDWYSSYPEGAVTDPTGPEGGEARALRGGSWTCGPDQCRSACRHRLGPHERSDQVGCRVVLGPE